MNRPQPWIRVLIAGLGLGIFLWWFFDHRRGIQWAIRAIRRGFPDVPHLTAAELSRWLSDENRPAPVIIDARTQEEFATSHIRGAERVEGSDLARVEELAAGSRPIVVYCAAGYRAAQLARQFQEAGAQQVANLDGGIFAWANEGYEVVRDDEAVRPVHPYHGLFARLLHPSRRPRG